MSGSATHLLWARMCGRRGPALSLWLACPAEGSVPRGRWEAVPGGLAFHSCEERLVSGAVPSSPFGGEARVPRPVFPRRSWAGRGDPAQTPQLALLRAVVARCGGCGRASPGGAPRAVAGGVSVQALCLPRLPVLAAGCRDPLPTCCGRGCAGLGAQQCPFGLGALQWARCRGGGGRPSWGSGLPPL